MQALFRKEHVTGDNQYFCEKCDCKQDTSSVSEGRPLGRAVNVQTPQCRFSRCPGCVQKPLVADTHVSLERCAQPAPAQQTRPRDASTGLEEKLAGAPAGLGRLPLPSWELSFPEGWGQGCTLASC